MPRNSPSRLSCWRAFKCRLRTRSFTFVSFLWTSYRGATRDSHGFSPLCPDFTVISSDVVLMLACRTPIENAGTLESVTSISPSYSTAHLEIGTFFRHHLRQKRKKTTHYMFGGVAALSSTLFLKTSILFTKDSQREQQRSSDRRCSACFVRVHREYMSQPDG